MRISGVVLILFAGLIFSGSIVLAKKFHPLIGGTFLLGFPALIPGIYMASKSYWKDPSYVKRIAEKHRHLNFEQLVEKFGLEPVYNKMYDQPTLSAKFEQYGKSQGFPNYWAMHNKYNQYNFYDIEVVKRIYLDHFENHLLSHTFTQNGALMTIGALIDKGIIPFQYLQEKFLKESRGMSLRDVLRDYSWEIFDLKIADPKDYRDEIIHEMDQLNGPLENFLQKYSKRVITLGILPSNHPKLRKAFFEMMRRLPYSQIPSELLSAKYGLVPEEVREVVDENSSKASDISCWNSDQTHQAKARYYHSNNRPSIVTAMWTPQGYQPHAIPNPSFYSYGMYEREYTQDDAVRRPARIRSEVDAPWSQYFSQKCQKLL